MCLSLEIGALCFIWSTMCHLTDVSKSHLPQLPGSLTRLHVLQGSFCSGVPVHTAAHPTFPYFLRQTTTPWRWREEQFPHTANEWLVVWRGWEEPAKLQCGLACRHQRRTLAMWGTQEVDWVAGGRGPKNTWVAELSALYKAQSAHLYLSPQYFSILPRSDTAAHLCDFLVTR